MVCNKNPAPPYIEMGQATKTRYTPYIKFNLYITVCSIKTTQLKRRHIATHVHPIPQ